MVVRLLRDGTWKAEMMREVVMIVADWRNWRLRLNGSQMAVERVDLLGGPALESTHNVLLSISTSEVRGRLAVL